MQTVQQSFHRARNHDFAEHFYRVFLDSDPRIRGYFRGTDWARQKHLLTHSIFMLIDHQEGNPIGRMAMNRLAVFHDRDHLNVALDLYPVWIDKVIAALTTTDPEFTPTLEQKWRRALRSGIDYMLANAPNPAVAS